MAICPYCGKSIALSRTPERGMMQSWGRSMLLESTVSTPWPGDDFPAQPNFTEWERREPVRAATFESDVRVPFMTALFSGVFGGLILVMPAIYFHWPWWIPGTVACVVPGVVWAATVTDGRSMLRRVERIVNRDIDGDGAVGPVEHRTVIEGRIWDGEHVRDLILYFDGVRPDQIDTLFQAALSGGALNEAAWCGNSKPFAKAQFVGVRDRMIGAGLWAWANPDAHAQGVRISAAGRAIMSKWREQFARTHTHANTGNENWGMQDDERGV